MNKRQNQFIHYLEHTIREFEFRLTEVIDLCDESLKCFNTSSPKTKDNTGSKINYAFSAFVGLLQTLKDVLPIVLDENVIWSDLDSVRHLQFMKQCRNSITHDGMPIINLWAEGKFYIACDFYRVNNQGKTELVYAPEQDIATICKEFSIDFISLIKGLIDNRLSLLNSCTPLYDKHFTGLAMNHPAIPDFARKLHFSILDEEYPQVDSGLRKRLADSFEKIVVLCKKE
ncbi:MAG: hypothetical protein V3U64_01020 [Cocleimonas sp.]